MRKFKFTLIAFMAAMMALSFTACSDDDPEPNQIGRASCRERV